MAWRAGQSHRSQASPTERGELRAYARLSTCAYACATREMLLYAHARRGLACGNHPSTCFMQTLCLCVCMYRAHTGLVGELLCLACVNDSYFVGSARVAAGMEL